MDQAAHLRSLVLKSMREHAAELGVPAQVVAVTGGQPGVGTTTIAVNMAIALAEIGSRVVLVDANLSHPNIAQVCAADGTGNLSDVLARRRDIHEVLQRGPDGIQLVTGGAASPYPYFPSALHRLIKQLKTLGRHADVVIVDTGCGASEVAKSFWEAADEVVLVSTAGDEAVTIAYSTIKLIACDDIRPKIRLLLNQVDSVTRGEEIYSRMDRCTQEHLQMKLQLLGCITHDVTANSQVAEELQRTVAKMVAGSSLFAQTNIEPPIRAAA